MSQADAPAPATHPRQERSYSLDGLPDREVLVFKSMVRLLGHRTHFAWVYCPSSTELRVVAEGLATAALQAALTQQVLTLGAGNIKRQSYLRLPLHANELEAELNRLGALISPVNQTTAAVATAASTTPMRMLRWPPASLLTTSTRVRLATLMAGRPLTMAELAQRSKENLAVCTAFFDDLRQLNLLMPVATVSPSAMASTPPVAAAHQPHTHRPVQPGLLDRIRMRLGLQMTSITSRT
jgi:hypothetical protein